MCPEKSSAGSGRAGVRGTLSFSADLKALYEAAGGQKGLGYRRLIDLAKQHGYEISTSTLSDWFRKAPPQKPEHVKYVLRVLIPFLEQRAALRMPPNFWPTQLKEAQGASRSRQGGPGLRVKASSRGRLLGGPSQALRDVLPVELSRREGELADLAAFATAPDGAPAYLWWQAGPWAGKTAMMAWFAAHCVPDGVDVVHYVIARRLGTDRRDGFVQTVAKQLAVAAGGKRRPAVDGKRPDLYPQYEAAALASRERQRRLLLFVDGLDEDADVGPDGQGIAGLLPKVPPHGMRVIVTGRPFPGIPVSLAADHPLRDPTIVRQLTESPAARIIRDTALTELRALLTDRAIGQRLLGLLVAARGALTGADLGDLLDIPPYEVQERLRSVVGRSLTPTRIDLLSLNLRTQAEADAGRQALVLAHDELHRTAREELGRRSLAARTQDLHGWARQYQGEGWPEDTPNYLLTGYARLLHETGDTERLTALVLDPQRQLRLAQRSGADVALRHLALIAPLPDEDQAPPVDQTTAAALGVSRELLRAGVRALPDSVMRTIARLGDTRRARALASSLGRAVDRALSLASVARVLQAMGDEQAGDTAREAGIWARTALREGGRHSYTADEAEAAAALAALALLETCQMGAHRGAQDVGAADQQILGVRGGPVYEISSLPREGLGPHGRREDGLALLRSTRGTGTARCEAWALAARLLEPDHPEHAAELLDELEEQAEELVTEGPGKGYGAGGAIQLWQTVVSAAPDRADRLHDRALEHAQATWEVAPTLENVGVVATAASFVALSRPVEAERLAAAACQYLEEVFLPDAGPLSPADGFHLEFGFRHTIALLSQALTDVGSAPETTTRVLEMAQQVLAENSANRPGQDPDEGEDQAFTEATALADEAFRLAERGTTDEAERRLEQALSLLPVAGRGNGRSPVWLPDLAGALVRTGAAADGEKLLDLVRHPADGVRMHTAMALAYMDSQRPDAGRHHAQEASRTAASASPSDGSWTHAAQALACAGEVKAALNFIEHHGQPDGAGTRAAWRKTDRAVRIAVATELATADPQASSELISPLLTRLDAARHAIRSQGLLTLLAELLPATAHLPPEQQSLFDDALNQACAQAGRSNPQSWQPEDTLVHAFLRLSSGEDPSRQLDWLTNDMAIRGTEHFPTAALAVLHTALGDIPAAERVATRPATPEQQAKALAAVAGHLVRFPTRPNPSPDPLATDRFTHTIRHLALTATPTATPANTEALKPLPHVLTSTGWYHAIPLLAPLAPEAVAALRNIAVAHLGQSSNPQHR
ncbi:hypothetical protein ABZ891_09560 [Streptomyces sp. NPDC047023]|uniref:hypothetical protein n=1 Tax=Streptomyces sp. NPDC047023 TaxID=3155139 RepID=UPI0033D26F8A